MAAATDRGVPLSTLCPKFLHANSTSHTWPFSAIAELIDNAYDPDVNAKQLWIDKTIVNEQECLSFMDNGNGLDHETMHKMLSFGYSDKIAVNGVQPIGIYGNGFKSGSMRLGKDAIVFSKSKSTSCVGMLSQTYLERIGAKQISVPIVCFEQNEHKASLQDILKYSPFTTQKELLNELNAISHPICTQNTGTRIIIWNLRRTSNGTLEFDFVKDRYDIRIPIDVCETMNEHPDRATSFTPESVYSLRAYCSVLYLKPRMQVVIRGQKVKSQLIEKSLACIRKDHYKPVFLNKRIRITFGYNTKSKDQYGIMMYHKNRLIKAYERVGCQLKANNQGAGVIGVIECNFLDPTHNKQSFIETDKYRKTIYNLGLKLEEYWKEIRYTRNKDNPACTTPVEDTMKRPDQNWVQCDECLQWRKLPDGINHEKLPDKWFCHMNPDPQFRSCSVEQEPEDSDNDQPTYRKTYKLQAKRTQLASPETTPKRPRVQRRTSDTNVRPLFSPPVPVDNGDDTDDDIVILETASTPKPKNPGFDLTKVKTETGQSDADINMLVDCNNAAAVDVKIETNGTGTGSTGSPGVATSPLSAPPPELASTTTQTEMPKVKKEEREIKDEIEERAEQGTSNGVARSDNQDRETLQNKVTPNMESDEDVESFLAYYCNEGQKQQDQLLEMVQETAQERDAFKEEVHKLTCQLQDLQSRQQELSQIRIKKECSHQAVQTENAKEKVNESIDSPDEENIFIQVDYLLRELDQSNKEKDRLRSQVRLDSLEEERATLASQCEELKLSLQQQRENAQGTSQRVTASSVQTDPEETGGAADSGTDSTSDTLKSLIELRQNIGHLLVTYVPALDLDQVNFECNVIDEILEQVVQQHPL
uniref:CW-type domain-containing protein n=1 Tax=Anabas testudineus TaxID=64144 RepID=A0A7N5ZR87_ANATE